jgi:endonuclease/exonuclease/phosphatase (EEP) superfamily protein YafD
MNFLLNILIIATCHAMVIPSDNNVLLNLGNSSTESLPSKKIQVLVWNLHKGQDQDFKKDFTSLSKDKDLIVSQEMLLNTEMRGVFYELPDYLFSTATSFLIGEDLARTGVAIGSQAPVHSSQFIRSRNVEPFSDTPKMALINQYPIQNHTDYLTVVNLHAINFVTAKVFQEEMEQISLTILSLKLDNHPLILAGDFNTWNNDRLLILSDLKNKLHLQEAIFHPDHRLTFWGHPLDHVLYSTHLKLVSAKADNFYKGSDHKPLELIFNFK